MFSRAVGAWRVSQDSLGTQVHPAHPFIGRGTLPEGLSPVSPSLCGFGVYRAFGNVADGNARNPTPGQRQCLSDHVVGGHAEGACYYHPALIHEGCRGPGVAAEGPGGAAVRHRLYRGVHQDLLRRLSSAGSLHDDGGPSVSSAYRHPFPSALCRRAGRCARSALSHASRVWHSQGACPQVYPAS